MITAKVSDEIFTSQMIYDLYVRPISVLFITFAVLFIISGILYEKSVLKDLMDYKNGLGQTEDQVRDTDGNNENDGTDTSGLAILV